MLSGDRDIEDIQGVPRKKFPMLKMSLDMGFYYFKPNFLSPPWSKMKNFSVHQKEEDLRISKITLLLFLVPFLGKLWPLRHGKLFLGHPVEDTETHVVSHQSQNLRQRGENTSCYHTPPTPATREVLRHQIAIIDKIFLGKRELYRT